MTLDLELSGTRLTATVLVTRPRDQAGQLWERLSALGATVVVQPAITIMPPRDWGPVDAALAQLDRYDWLVFSSANGVRYLLGRLLETGSRIEQLRRLQLAAIGPGTAEELARHGLVADLVPPQYRAESLSAALAAMAPGSRFLLARASRGREVLAAELAAAGGAVEQIIVYTSSDVETPDAAITAMLSAGRIDWITVSSSAIARSLARLFGADLRRAKLVSISPLTSETLRQLGFSPAAEATVYTMDGMVDAMLRFLLAQGYPTDVA